jgi:hypothetical protein
MNIYRCGCRADGDNVAASCPMHSEPEITPEEYNELVASVRKVYSPPDPEPETEIERLTARITELEANLAEMADARNACAETAATYERQRDAMIRFWPCLVREPARWIHPSTLHDEWEIRTAGGNVRRFATKTEAVLAFIKPLA